MMIWLTPARTQRFAVVLLAVNILLVLAVWGLSRGGLDYAGRPVGADFLAFWEAGWLALRDNINLANGTLAKSAITALAPTGQSDVLLWTYPPPFLLLLAPLAMLPYLPALFVFTTLSLALGAMAVQQVSRARLVWLLWLGAPATLVCVLGGQTGMMLAAIALLGFSWRERRPLLAGACLSLLCIKPHFAALIPLFLLVQRDYKCLFGFIAGGAVLALASVAVFGLGSWLFFLEQMPKARLILEQGAPPWEKMTSVFVSARQLGAPILLAWGLHFSAIMLAVVMAWPVLRTRGPLAVAALLLLILILAPYQFDYDQGLALVALVFWFKAHDGNWLKGEQATVTLLWLGPLLFSLLAGATKLGLAPLAVFAALYYVRQRANTPRAASPIASSPK
jgi:hypothetical protein